MGLRRDEWLKLMDECVVDLMECENAGDRLKLMVEMDEYADMVRCVE